MWEIDFWAKQVFGLILQHFSYDSSHNIRTSGMLSIMIMSEKYISRHPFSSVMLLFRIKDECRGRTQRSESQHKGNEQSRNVAHLRSWSWLASHCLAQHSFLQCPSGMDLNQCHSQFCKQPSGNANICQQPRGKGKIPFILSFQCVLS